MLLQVKAAMTPTPSFTPARNVPLQRKCACGGTPGPTGECEACRKKRLQRFTSRPSTFNSQLSEVPPIVHEVLRSLGQPLDPETRAFMEPRFEDDFSGARIHTDEYAGDSARSVNALAGVAEGRSVPGLLGVYQRSLRAYAVGALQRRVSHSRKGNNGK